MSERTVSPSERLAAGRSYAGRTRYITVRLREDELAYAKGRAAERGMTVSEWVRVLIVAEGRGTEA